MDHLAQYLETIKETLERINQEERKNIERAGEEIAKRIAEDRLLYVFGTGGHSYMAGEELFYRAGGLVPVNPILDSGVSLLNGAWRTTHVERVPGYAQGILKYYRIKNGDIIIINNAAGVNSMTIDAALECKKLGVFVIGISANEFSSNIPAGHPARHPSNKNLYEVADINIDIKAPLGDAIIEIEGVDQKIAPVSTIAISFVLHSIVIKTVEKLVEMGVKPPVWRSANIPGGDEANKKYLDKYLGIIKQL